MVVSSSKAREQDRVEAVPATPFEGPVRPHHFYDALVANTAAPFSVGIRDHHPPPADVEYPGRVVCGGLGVKVGCGRRRNKGNATARRRACEQVAGTMIRAVVTQV